MDNELTNIFPKLGRFTDDLELPGMAHLVFVGSPHPHARINRIDTRQAEKAPGVLMVLTGRELARHTNPLPQLLELGNIGWDFKAPAEVYPLAVNKVRYQGEPVAAVIAEDHRQAVRAAELIEIDYDPLPVTIDALPAMSPESPLLYEEWGDNIQAHRLLTFGDVQGAFDEADRVIEVSWKEARASGFPLEPRGCLSSYDPATGTLDTRGSYQCPFRAQQAIAHVLRLPTTNIKVTAAAIGGAFGNRINCSKHAVVCFAALHLCRPVKWFESHRESICTGVHQRDVLWSGQVAFNNDGQILGIKTRFIQNVGVEISHRGYGGGSLMAAISAVPNTYQLKGLEIDAYAVVTNKSFYGAYRGYGKDKGLRYMERIMDRLARELEMTPEEIRYRNFIPPTDFPYHQITGYVYDSGDYPALMTKAIKLADLNFWREKQTAARAKNRYIGIGMAFIIEPAGVASTNVTSGLTQARIKLTPDGLIEAHSDRTEIGQGAEESHRIVISDILGIAKEDVIIPPVSSDTIGQGPVSSRGSVYSLSALAVAAKQMKAKVIQYATHFFETAAEDIAMENGAIFSIKNPEQKMNYRELAKRVYFLPGPRSLPMDMKMANDFLPDVQATWFSPSTAKNPSSTYTTFCMSVDIVVVEVDVETGAVKILKMTHVHDAGNIISRELVEGQIHGGVAQGLGEALFEEIVYGDNGDMLTESYTNYLLPTALEVPEITIGHMQTPSPFTELGTKGMGEAPLISSKAALIASVEDALAPLGVEINESPATRQRVRQWVRNAQATAIVEDGEHRSI
ncbi:MAG: xanthine dehydrogenase family protein molybdopterin-binding subunit [Deltaproteobacteria bacterium]|nr:xanthine dehydrogenase family protein molybdopterin-binding subunit [Deltaproteobacteria bacterium]